MNDRFAPIVLMKSAAQLFGMLKGIRRGRVRLLSGRYWGGQRDQLCQLSEVLDCSSEKELVLSTGRASQPEPGAGCA